MAKALQDGLILDNSYLIIDEKKPGLRIPARAIQLFAIIIGSWSAFWVLLKSLAAPVDIYYINAAILICACIMFALSIFPSYDLVKLFFVVLFYGLFFYSRLPELKNGFYHFENMVIYRLHSCYGYSGYYFLADASSKMADTTLLTIMIIIPVMALFTVAVVRNRLVNLCSLILFLPVAASFLLGIIPSEKYLIAYIAAILYLTKSGLPYRHVTDRRQRSLLHRISSRAAVWMSLLGLLVFFILKLFISENQYDNIAQLNDMKAKVQQTFTETSLQDISQKFNDYRLFEFEAANGGLLGGELSKDGKVEYTGSEQLIIKAPIITLSGGVYLKGYVGCEYTGKRWAGHTQKDREKYYDLLDKLPASSFSAVNQTNLLLELVLKNPLIYQDLGTLQSLNGILLNISGKIPYYISQGTMQVEYKDANKRYIYAPYYTNYALLERSYYEQDLYTAPSIRSDYYEFNYYYNVTLGSSTGMLMENIEDPDYIVYEKLYRDYVNEVYTKLPEKGLDQLKKDFADNEELETLSLTEKLDYVKSYLEQNTEYTLSPGTLPKGKDFVEYFLYENKKGYCSHYASAAVLMLRAMGVPARYAEGYAIGAQQVIQRSDDPEQSVSLYTEDGKGQIDSEMMTVTVQDNNAHAWVEIYINGCGWIPVEFTPGAAMEYNTSVISELSEAQEYLDNSDEEVLPTQEPEPTQAAVDQQQDEQDKPSQQKEDIATAAAAKEKARLDQVFILAFLLLAVVAVGVLLIIAVKRRRRLRSTRNPNRRAILLFARIEKILSSCKSLPGKKARLEDSEEYVREQSRYIDQKQFNECMETVKRARFGSGFISAKELRQLEEFHAKLYQEVYEELPMHRKLGLRLALFL
jgi:transglutaminase-like putative cysteine protease